MEKFSTDEFWGFPSSVLSSRSRGLVVKLTGGNIHRVHVILVRRNVVQRPVGYGRVLQGLELSQTDSLFIGIAGRLPIVGGKDEGHPI